VKIEHILVPVDFSDTSRRALVYAVDLAGSVGCDDLTVVHVAMRPTEYLPLDDWVFGKHTDPESVEAKVRQSARSKLDSLLERFDDRPLSLEPRVELGPASATIVEVAKEVAARMIVMGTRGRNVKILQRAAGSTAIRVIRASDCPVLCVA